MPLQPKDMIELLRGACPTAASAWNEHVKWWGDQEPGHYNDMAIFSQHIVACDSKMLPDELPAFFALLERFLTEGSEEVRGLAVVGLLEDLMTVASHTPQGSTRLEPLLGPLSRQAWNELVSLWAGQSSLMDVIRSQRSDA